MADGLAEALAGLQASPAQNPYGIASAGLASATPNLFTPYTSPGAAIGIGLGSVLLQSLLGYQARQSALQETLQANTLANQMLKLQTPEERTSFVGGLDVSPDIGTKLSTLSTALTTQDLSTKLKLNEAVGLETGRMKALQDFYASPEGAAQREFELKKIKEEAAARRTPLDDLLAQETAKKERQLAVEAAKNVNRIDLEDLKAKARSGDKDADRTFKERQAEIQREHEKELATLKIELGGEKRLEVEERQKQMEMALIADGKDPDVARAQARISASQEARNQYLEKQDQLTRERNKEYQEALTARMRERKQLDLQFPALTAKTKDAVADAGPFANLAKDLASDIRKVSSYPEYQAAKNISAISHYNIKSRTVDIVDRLTRARSGLATRGVEDEAMQTILLGDSTLGPAAVADLIERVANDTLKVAADKVSAGTQSPAAIANAYRQAAEQNMKVPLSVQTFNAGAQTANTAPTSTAPTREELIAELKRRGVLK